MRKLLRFTRPVLLTTLLLPAACAVEAPYPEPPAPAASPLSAEEVVKILLAGASEEELLKSIRTGGLLAWPTPAEIQALRLVGASDRMLAAILSMTPVRPLQGPPFLGSPMPLVPGYWPLDGWFWLEAVLKDFPQPDPPVEVEP